MDNKVEAQGYTPDYNKLFDFSNAEVASEFDNKNEITIKTAKGLVGDVFKAKDGNEYRQISIPNLDDNDKSPWATFVQPANAIHEDKFGNGMWFKVPGDGNTTLSKGMLVGKDQTGKNIYENMKKTVSNKDLKAMVEYYKERPREQENDAKSFKEQVSEAKSELKEKKSLKDLLVNDKKAKVKSKSVSL